MHVTDLVPILEIAIGPVILISGVGLLVLSMTNRLGRVSDRTRLLAEALRKPGATEPERLSSQLKILSRRAELIRLAIILAILSVFLACVLIIALFFGALFGLEIAVLLILLFVGSMGSLLGSLVLFIGDINLSLAALRLEISDDAGDSN